VLRLALSLTLGQFEDVDRARTRAEVAEPGADGGGGNSARGLGGLQRRGATVTPSEDGALYVTGLDAPEIGHVAADTATVLYELTPQHASLEEAFMELTRDSVDYHAEQPATSLTGVPAYEGA
jgi:hypothetical protein